MSDWTKGTHEHCFRQKVHQLEFPLGKGFEAI